MIKLIDKDRAKKAIEKIPVLKNVPLFLKIGNYHTLKDIADGKIDITDEELENNKDINKLAKAYYIKLAYDHPERAIISNGIEIHYKDIEEEISKGSDIGKYMIQSYNELRKHIIKKLKVV